ncbi:unnamed protein product, partial [Mesorhabditis spiculigera]
MSEAPVAVEARALNLVEQREDDPNLANLSSMDDFTTVKDMDDFYRTMMHGMLFFYRYRRNGDRYANSEIYPKEVPALVKAGKVFKPLDMNTEITITGWPEDLYPFHWIMHPYPSWIKSAKLDWADSPEN